MIKTPLLRKYRNGELIQYCKDITSICDKSDAVTLKIETQVNGLKLSLLPLEEQFVIKRGSSATPNLEELDEARDNALSGINAVAEGFTLHFDNTISKSAIAVVAAFAKYGKNLARLNYVAETQVIESIVKDFETNVELKSAIAILKLAPWVSELKATNQRFNEQYLSRASENAQKPQAKVLDLKAVIIEKYRALANHITAHSTLNTSEAYNKLINELNSITDKYNLIVARRGNDDPGEEEPIK